MDRMKVKELFNSFLEFIPLYHETIGCIYNKDYDIDPNLNKNQRKALFIIKKNGRIMPSSLGKALDMQKGSLTTLVDSLVEHEFVRRDIDKEDRRKQWISLTPEGEEYILKLMHCFEKEFEKTFEKVDAENIDNMINSINYVKRILANIKNIKGQG